MTDTRQNAGFESQGDSVAKPRVGARLLASTLGICLMMVCNPEWVASVRWQVRSYALRQQAQPDGVGIEEGLHMKSALGVVFLLGLALNQVLAQSTDRAPNNQHLMKGCPAHTVRFSTTVKKPAPSYTAKAREYHVEGVVKLPILIDELGRFERLLPGIQGPRRLRGVAIEEAKKTHFSPTTLSGIAVKVCGVLTYDFTLNQ